MTYKDTDDSDRIECLHISVRLESKAAPCRTLDAGVPQRLSRRPLGYDQDVLLPLSLNKKIPR